ncbi:MAG: ABC transporter permease [Vulcanimicrobiaceae bacterium]
MVRTIRLNRWDLITLPAALILAVLFGWAVAQMLAPFSPAHPIPIGLDPRNLPGYALRTTTRMLIGLVASWLFTLVYATAAAKSRRAEQVLIPLLDVLQSVPVLGYLSFSVAALVALTPGRQLGAELASIFAIFTAEAWNMTFSLYQSLRTIPGDLSESASVFRLSPWQRFWRLEMPFGVPGMVWNSMMSMSGAWFFVVASEAITVGTTTVALPGVGSYVALAIQKEDLQAISYAILTMVVVIVLYDQLLFRPLVVWSEKFRVEQTAGQSVGRSWVLDALRGSAALRAICGVAGALLAASFRVGGPMRAPAPAPPATKTRTIGDMVWYACLALVVGALVAVAVRFIMQHALWHEAGVAMGLGAITLVRVMVLVALASIIWLPIGIFIGLNPNLAGRVQALAQVLAAFPANLLFPLVVVLVVRYHLNADIWLSPLMILGTQWYILFNVIAGASTFPTDLREAASTFHVRGLDWWSRVMLPGVFPFFVTGAITASGGSWNASIVAETVSWGKTTISAKGLGSYIALATTRGDMIQVGIGVAVMSLYVVLVNRLLWRPLYVLADRKIHLD